MAGTGEPAPSPSHPANRSCCGAPRGEATRRRGVSSVLPVDSATPKTGAGPAGATHGGRRGSAADKALSDGGAEAPVPAADRTPCASPLRAGDTGRAEDQAPPWRLLSPRGGRQQKPDFRAGRAAWRRPKAPSEDHLGPAPLPGVLGQPQRCRRAGALQVAEAGAGARRRGWGGAGGGVSTAHSSWHHRFLRESLLSLSLKCGFSSETTKLLSAGLKLPCLLTSFTFSCENRTRRKALRPGDPPARVASSIFSRVNSVLWKLEITHFLVTNFTACILHLLGLTWGVFNQH